MTETRRCSSGLGSETDRPTAKCTNKLILGAPAVADGAGLAVGVIGDWWYEKLVLSKVVLSLCSGSSNAIG